MTMKRTLAVLVISLGLAVPAAAQFGTGRIGSPIPNIKKVIEKSTLTFTAPITFDGILRASGEIQVQESADCDALTPSRTGALCYDTGNNELMFSTSTSLAGYAAPGGGVALGDSPTWTGNHIWNNSLLVPFGSGPNPSYAFSGDTNTGMYRVSSDQLGFSAAGAFQIIVRTNGVQFAQPILEANGTQTNPIYTFNFDVNTGMFRPAADNLGFSTAGSEKIRIVPSGGLRLFSRTIAQLAAITPGLVGEQYYCSDCTLAGGRAVISTGTSAGNFADADGSDWE